MNYLRRFLLFALFPFFVLAQNHLLISEFVVSPTAGEFIEIYNPTGSTLDLSDYYITDATNPDSGFYYYNIVTGSNAGGGQAADFHARFPDGAAISPGEYQTLAMNGTGFINTYPGKQPTYELYNTNASIPDMREALPGLINGQGGLSNDGEAIIFYTWDGQSDLVQDGDYAVWGDKREAVDKTGVSIDGPDPGSTPSTYLNDTPIPLQISISPGLPHGNGESVQRFSPEEYEEIQSGGNGITGDDETSENLALSFKAGPATPNEGAPASNPPVIANITLSPANPTPADTVTVSAEVTDDGTVVSVFLHYSINGAAFDSSAMNLAGGDTYQGTIDPQPENTMVNYFVIATDNDTLTTSSPTSSYTVIPPPQVVPIADIQENFPQYQGQIVIVEGVITLGSGITTTGWTSVYVQDNSGRGINVFRSAVIDPAFMRGNAVRVTGRVDEFNGVTEIVDYSVQVLSTGNPIPNPLPLSTAAANDITLEGTYITFTGEITDLVSFPDASNITVNDGSGATLVRVWATTGIDLSAFSLGDQLTVRSVMSVFNNAAQYTPGYQDELTTPGINPGDGSGTATIAPDMVNPSENVTETITITGDFSYTLETISITIPDNWGWAGGSANVQLSGSGFTGANANISGNLITVMSAAVSSSNSGVVTISALTAPNRDVTSTFIVKTATAGGTLLPLSSSPVVTVGAGGPEITPIAAIQANPSAFTNVTIEGVVTIGSGIIASTWTSAYVQDNSGIGINIYRAAVIDTSLVRRRLVRISGSVDEFNGVTEIVNYTLEVLANDQPLPDTLKLTTAEAGEVTLEGAYVQVTGEVLDIATGLGGGSNITVDDGSGPLTVRVWDTAGLDIGFISIGDTLITTAVIGIFNNATQLIPGYQDELKLAGQGNGEGSATLNIASVPMDTLVSVTAFLQGGESGNVLRTVRMLLPFNWAWTGEAGDVSLSGNAFANAGVTVGLDYDQYQIDITNCALTLEDSGAVTIRNLATPDKSVYSYFWIKTAVQDGVPDFIISSPRVVVGSSPEYQMRDIQTNPGQFRENVTLTGIVTIGGGVIREGLTTAYFQDESGRGIQIFSFNDPTSPPNNLIVRGYKLRLTGVVSEFSETTQIIPSSIARVDTLVYPEPAPIELSTEEAFNPRWDGTLIRIHGLVTEKYSTSPAGTPAPDYNIEVNDGSGAILLRVWGTTGIDLSEINVNNAIFATGAGSVFIDNQGVRNYQLLPAYQDQLKLDSEFQPSLANVGLKLPPHPFAPDIGERIKIQYDAGFVLNHISIRIFDLGGRLITTLLDEDAQLIRNTLEWDGRDRLHERVPLGTYICLMEVIEPQTGKKVTKTAPIVVGTVLSQ